MILPLSLTATSLVREATSLYDRIQSGDLNHGTVFQQLRDALPTVGNQSSRPLRADEFWVPCRKGSPMR